MAFRLELARLLGWRRWFVAGLAFAAIACTVGVQLQAEVANAKLEANQWDVVMAVFNNAILVTFLLTPGLLAVVGDVCLGDRRSRFAMLTVPRSRSRTAWWLSKLGAELFAGCLYGLLAMVVIASIGGAVIGFGWQLSSWSLGNDASSATFGAFNSPVPPVSGLPIVGVAVVALYFGLAAGAFAAPILAVSQLRPKPWLPLAIGVGVSLLFFRVPVFTVMHPLIHLFWTFHQAGNAEFVVTWWASAAYLSVELLAAIAIGRAILARVDL